MLFLLGQLLLALALAGSMAVVVQLLVITTVELVVLVVVATVEAMTHLGMEVAHPL
jgi:hypothetical protein